MVGDTVRPRSRMRVRVHGGAGTFLRVITDGGRQAVGPVPVTSPRFGHRFRLPAGTTWARAELFDPDLAQERGAAATSRWAARPPTAATCWRSAR